MGRKKEEIKGKEMEMERRERRGGGGGGEERRRRRKEKEKEKELEKEKKKKGWSTTLSSLSSPSTCIVVSSWHVLLSMNFASTTGASTML